MMAKLGYRIIGDKKLTKDRIKADKVFPANLVTEEILPIADYFGNFGLI